MTYYLRYEAFAALMSGALVLGMVASGTCAAEADRDSSAARRSDFLTFSAPAGERPATTETIIDGLKAAILPNGRLITPAGVEASVEAPKPFGLALSPDSKMLATLNSGAGPFSLTLTLQRHLTHGFSHTPLLDVVVAQCVCPTWGPILPGDSPQRTFRTL